MAEAKEPKMVHVIRKGVAQPGWETVATHSKGAVVFSDGQGWFQEDLANTLIEEDLATKAPDEVAKVLSIPSAKAAAPVPPGGEPHAPPSPKPQSK